MFYGTIPDPSTGEGFRDHCSRSTGDVLTGFPGCPGKVTGVARVILDPADPTAPRRDPRRSDNGSGLTPLFVAAVASSSMLARPRAMP